jgi:outer membrane lipoprotein SlyB
VFESFEENCMTVGKWMQATFVALLLTLSGCSSSPYQSSTSSYPAASQVAYGTVESIEVTDAPKSGIGLGSVAGAVVGGVLGHQVGGGRGNTAATIGGAVAGGVAGHEVEKRTGNQAATYRVRVRLDNGSTEMLNQESAADLRVGGRVRVENGRAYPI